MPWKASDKDPAYGTAAWKRARTACLRNANWRCEIRIDGVCIGAATQADHIYGLANDRDHKHLRAACTPCHRHVTARQGGRNGGNGDPEPSPRTAW